MLFDGSYQGRDHAGIGITVHLMSGILISSASVTATTADAQHTETLGLTLLALLQAPIEFKRGNIFGDILFIIGLLNRRIQAKGLYLYNCVQLFMECQTTGGNYMATWIGQALNSTCDRLDLEATAF